MNEMKNYHLITMPHNHGRARNHGLVQIGDDGYVNGEIPVEDFGMYFFREEPFPTDPHEIAKIFFQLMEDEAPGLDDVLPGETLTCAELAEGEEGRRRLFEWGYYGNDMKEEVLRIIHPIKR